MHTVFTLFPGLFAGLGRSRQDLLLENFALRHQLMMCERRPRVTEVDRLLWAHVLRRWSGWRLSLVVLHPDTVVRWHRRAGAGTGRGRAAPADPGGGGFLSKPVSSFSGSLERTPAGAACAFAPSCGPWDTTSAPRRSGATASKRDGIRRLSAGGPFSATIATSSGPQTSARCRP